MSSAGVRWASAMPSAFCTGAEIAIALAERAKTPPPFEIAALS